MKNVVLQISHGWGGRCHRCLRPIMMLVLLAWSTSFVQAQGVVKGKVTGASGEGIPGVTVLLKGSSSGSVTDAVGAYSIEVPNGDAVLIFSFIGYVSQETTVGNRSTIDIRLLESLESLEEVVIVGYGVQKKSDITGAMSNMREQEIRDVPVANVTQALQGRVAGVEINSTSSRPGAGAQIRIRGNRSLTASNEPLIVLNGIPYTGTINDINPYDIVSLDILKDASATAIYGSRGANGVILVTTRRGKEGKTSFYYDGFHGVTSALGKYGIMNGVEYDAMRTEARAAGAAYGPTPAEAANLAAGRQVDWQDEAYGTGIMTNHLVGAQGGTADTQYNISAGYFKESTVLPGQEFSRYSIQGTIDQKIGSRLRLGINTMNQFNIRDGEGVSMMFSLLTLSPLFDAYNPDGSLNMFPAVDSPNPETINPLLVKDQSNWKQQRRRLRTFNSLYGEVDIATGFKYRLNVGLDLWQDNFGEFTGSNTPFRNGSANGAYVENTNSWSYTLENIFTYEKTIADKHKLLFTGLFSVQEAEEFRSSAQSNSLPADYMFYYNLGLGTSTVPLNNNYYFKWGLLSYMGRVNYSYQDRFMATLTVRADASSRLAKGNQWFTYPAAAVAWNLHNESFLKGSNLISNLKLRYTIGTVSNQAVNPYASWGGLGGFDGRNAEPYNFGSTGVFGYLVTASPNPYLSWEFTTTNNLGIDFGFLRNRITGSLELYQQDTKDVLQNVALPPTSGVGGVTKNVGETRNRGVELTLSSVNIESSSGFTWSTDFNFFLNRNEITFLAGGVEEDISRAWFRGRPIDVIFDYEKVGIVQQGETALPGFIPGNIKIKDQNGDGVINAADRVILGTLQPDWSGGLTSRMNYKGFDFNFVMFWRVGGLINSNFYGTHLSNPLNSLEGRRNGPKVDYWTPDNPTNAYPRPGQGQGPNFGSTLGYFDGTFLKVRSIQLGYAIPQSLLGKLKMSSLYVYAQAQNPFKAFFSDYVNQGGLDPETNGTGGTNTPGFGNRLSVSANTPVTRSFLLGLNFRF